MIPSTSHHLPARLNLCLPGVSLSNSKDPARIRARIAQARRELESLETDLESNSLRANTRAVWSVNESIRSLGKALMPGFANRSARDRLLAYFRAHTGDVIDGQEILVISGISEYGRRIRELRVEFGWPILSGHTLREMRESKESVGNALDTIDTIKSTQYVLIEDRQDMEAANRWRTANSIRRRKGGVSSKLLAYFRLNVGKPITLEELRYVANDRTEWARRTRELRTEEAWPIVTKSSGDPSLPVGVYVLAEDRQGEPHDRHISELVRREVMKRDNGSCRWVGCTWPVGFPKSDKRFLEVHHVHQHVDGGVATPENLVTLCNLHHDEVHRTGKLEIAVP